MHDMDFKMLIDIVILPSVNLRKRIGSGVKKAARGMKTVYLVDDVKYIPHISLFHLNIKRNGLKEIYKIFNKLNKKIRPISLNSIFVKLFKDGENGIFSLRFNNPRQFKKLHVQVVQACYKLRTGAMPWTPKRKPDKLEKFYRNKYGSQHVFKMKHAHITLARLARYQDAEKVKKEFDKLKKIRIVSDQLAVCKVNYWHQATKILKLYKLK